MSCKPTSLTVFLFRFQYLYYSRKLSHANEIRRIVVWEQGRGIINNLGALRIKRLKDWGIYSDETHQVYNWDGTPSPVCHQWDRDHDLHGYVFGKRHRAWKKEWEEHKNEAEKKEQR